MEARLGVAAGAVVAGAVVAVGAGVALPLDDERAGIKTNCDDRWICWPKMPVNGPWGAALPASRIPIPSPRSTRMEENPKSIARPRGCPRPTRYKKSTETSWDDQTSRCHDGNVAPVDDDDRNEAACRRPSSRGFSRRPIRPRKPWGSVNRKTPRRSVKNDEPRWRVASAKSTRGNRSTVPLCDAIKGDQDGDALSHGTMVRRRRRRVSYRRKRRRRSYQRGEGLLSFLVPLAVAGAKILGL